MAAGETRPPAPSRALPAAERLRHQREFKAVYERGQDRHGRLLVIYLLIDPDLERKVGVVAGRRVGNAVRRNRAKRLLREAYRHLRSRLPGDGFRLVLVARRPCADASGDAVLRDLEQLLGSNLAPGPGLAPDTGEPDSLPRGSGTVKDG